MPLTIGDARSYLGKKVIEWAKTSPNDPRIPEALFIAIKANAPYRYACAFDEETMQIAESILRDNPHSTWTAKLEEDRYNQQKGHIIGPHESGHFQ